MSSTFFLTPLAFEAMVTQQQVVDNLKPVRNFALLQLLYKTGLQLGEVARLKVGDVYHTSNKNAGTVRERFGIENEKNPSHTKPVFLDDPVLREALAAYYKERRSNSKKKGYVGEGVDAVDRLFVNDLDQAFKENLVRKSGDTEYFSYAELSLLIKDLHRMGGVDDGTADCARRSWTVWLAMGLDGRAPVVPEFLQILRGDKRVQSTLGALKRILETYDPFDPTLFERFIATRIKSPYIPE